MSVGYICLFSNICKFTSRSFLFFRARDPCLASRFTTVRMHSALYAARSRNFPKIPKTLMHLGILLGMPNMRPVCKTVDGTDYIFQGVVGCLQKRTVSLIFVSGRMLQFMGTLENIHADGTFKKRPRKPRMSQIFNLVTNYGGVVSKACQASSLRMLNSSSSCLECLT